MRQDCAILLYELVKGCSLNVGKIVEQSILDYDENSFSRNIPHLSLITLLCIKGGVTFSETEEKCLRSSPLTLTKVLKTPTQGEEVESKKEEESSYRTCKGGNPYSRENQKSKKGGGGGGGGWFEDYLE